MPIEDTTVRRPAILVVIGPTASGKSDFAVLLAQQHNGEIISADSRQAYKGLDIGTGKITEPEMKGIPHHMLSTYELDDTVSVARYASDAAPIIEDILARGKTPIICGGTGQYVDALIYTATPPRVPPQPLLRKELEQRSAEELAEELKHRDPVRYASIDRHNRVRLIRALEIIKSLGTVPSLVTPELRYETEMYIMSPSRSLLKERIVARYEKRMKQGMLEEVQNIMKHGYTSEMMKKYGLEYVTLGAYIEGALSHEEVQEKLVTASLQYAKRQETWNKKYPRDLRIKIHIVPVE